MASLKNLLSVTFKNFNTIKTSASQSFCVRNFSVSRNLNKYEPDGKTFVSILNQEEGAPLMIDTYSMMGFRMNNGIFVVGPAAIFPQTVLSWDVKDDYDIHERSLSLFLHLSPKLDVLVIGLSDSRNHQLIIETRKNLYEMMKKFKREYKMNIEVLPTEHAVSTFNFLNTENRFVAAALIPPTYYSPNLDDDYRKDYLTKKGQDVLGLSDV